MFLGCEYLPRKSTPDRSRLSSLRGRSGPAPVHLLRILPVEKMRAGSVSENAIANKQVGLFDSQGSTKVDHTEPSYEETMSETVRNASRVQRFLASNPYCYFCGGTRRATTVDHVPPRACFPDGFMPEEFEFPACKECNEGATKQDQIFGLYAQLLDFDESKMIRPEDRAKIQKLRQGILNNYPDALPDTLSARPVYHDGLIQTLSPQAMSIQTPPELKEAVVVAGQKLAHALYMRETGKIMTAEHRFCTNVYQPQLKGTEALTQLFTSLLPETEVGTRRNIKDYGDRFRYMWGYKENEDFFHFAAQFGQGLILWAFVMSKSVAIPSSGPLSQAPWQFGSCGKGSLVSSSEPSV